ncbi:MAG: TlpA family protein disulfide reductase [Candidatus Latescibacteria bacterium]|nr:TlpA family protein disulfide reductase [Candidatus Latescibacterota bacterium]
MPALALLLFFLGCGAGPKQQEAAPASRVAAVKANPAAVSAAAGKWCDISFPAASAPAMELPPVAPARPNGSTPAFSKDRWVWLNVWATWCSPCIKEMPMMEQWKAQLQGEGVVFDLWYLSVDEQEKVLSNFLQQRPSMAPGVSLRLKDYGSMFPWLAKYQIAAEAAAIPIHMLVAPGGKVRCVHVGQLREGDYKVIKELMQ